MAGLFSIRDSGFVWSGYNRAMKRISVRLSGPFLAIALALPAAAQDFDFEKVEASVGLSTAGLSGTLGYRFNDKWRVRGFVGGGLDVAVNGRVSFIDYNTQIRLAGSGLLADYFVWGGTFRLTGGLYYSNNRATGNASGDLDIGGDIFDDVTIQATARPVNRFVPLFSAGWDLPLGESNLFFKSDIGVIYTEGFRARLTQIAGIPIPEDSILAEERQFLGDSYPVYPFISVALSYRF